MKVSSSLAEVRGVRVRVNAVSVTHRNIKMINDESEWKCIKNHSANTLIDLMHRKDALNARRQKLIDLYLDELIQHEVYKERYDLTQRDLSNLAGEIRNLMDEDFNFDDLFDQATSRLENTAAWWTNGNMKLRRKFQMSLFPGGLTYDSMHKFGTPLSTKGFNYLAMKNLDKKLMAGEQGVEPRLSDPETDVLPLDDSPARLALLYIKRRLSS